MARCAIAASVLSLSLLVPVGAQVEPSTLSGGAERSRADLEALLVHYEQVMESPAYSSELKAQAQERSAQIRARLSDGDFRLGDAVVLEVENEPAIPDTISVQSSPDGPILTLPLFGTVPLRGVLRSELEGRIAETLRQYIRNPVVRASGLMRLSVQGAVTRPGFYVVPADILIGEALMAAGGPAQNSAIDDLRIERGVEVLMDGEALQEEVRLGTTLDQLNLQAGDQIVLPAQGQGRFIADFGLIVGVLSSLTLLILQISG